MLIAHMSENTLDLKFKLFVVLKTVEALGNRCPSYSPYQQCPGSVQDECSCHADCDEANKYMCCFDGCRRRCRLTNASMYLMGLSLECFFSPRAQYSREFVECWVFLNCAQVFIFRFRMLAYTLVLLFVYRESLCLIRGLSGTHELTISALFPTVLAFCSFPPFFFPSSTNLTFDKIRYLAWMCSK